MTILHNIHLPTATTNGASNNKISDQMLVVNTQEPCHLPIDKVSPRLVNRNDYKRINNTYTTLFGNEIQPQLEQASDTFKFDEGHLDYLLTLVPREWKQQDHYQVLGLSERRYLATQDEIKVAHRASILKYHPDKLAGHNDTAYKCIAKAYEVLANPTKRHLFDSVDPGVNDAIPTVEDLQAYIASNEFYSKVHSMLVRELRFYAGTKTKIPNIGDSNSSKREVDTFYAFWYNFPSSRAFDYLDNEDAELADNRVMKRIAEQKNKNERVKRKNADNLRLRTLIDRIAKVDVRLIQFKEEAKRAKSSNNTCQQKLVAGGMNKDQQKGGMDEASVQAAKELQEKLELEKMQLQMQQVKLDKEQMKKIKKAIKQIVVKQCTYLHLSPTSVQMERTLMDLEALFDKYKSNINGLNGVLSQLQTCAAQSNNDIETVAKEFRSLL